jgi:hypothetical protein
MNTNESEFGGPLGYMPDGTGIYPISGAEGRRGYNTAGDILPTTLDGQPLDVLWSEFQTVLDLVNEQRTAVTNLLAFRTTRPSDSVAQVVGDDDFELASEFGEPKGLAGNPNILTTAYKFNDYDAATRFTFRYLRDATAEEIQEKHARALAADNKLTTNAILGRILDPTEDVNEDGQKVYGLYNGDSMVPPRHAFETHEAGHTHYLTTAGTALDGGDLDDMANHITHHGYGVGNGSRLVLLCNPAEMEAIASFRAGVANAKYDFIPSSSAPAYLTAETLVGERPPGSFEGLEVAGGYGRVWVAPTAYMPPGYLVMVATGGANSSLNPLGFREHPNAVHQGLRLLPGNQQNYPLIDSYCTRAFGVGVRHRGAAVVMQVTDAESPDPNVYTPPSALPPA